MTTNARHKLLHVLLAFAAMIAMAVHAAYARSPLADAQETVRAFADNCFSPYMTAEIAKDRFGANEIRYDFYDLDPFSAADPSPPSHAGVTQGTDRRCEVSFDGDLTSIAVDAVLIALTKEGILEEAAIPPGFSKTPMTALLAARQLNPSRVAVVHVGTRTGPNGIETFMNVERLMPSDDQS